MRTKALLGLAALAVGAITASAQTSVYSLNVVGYYNVTVPAGAYKLVANQLVSSDYKVSTLLNVPDSTKLYKWVGASYALNSYDSAFGWDDPNMTLGPGEATFVQNNSANPITITFVGEVNQNTNTTTIPVGYKMASLFTPQAGLLQTDFGFSPADSTVIYQWKGNSFSFSTYDAALGWDSEPNLGVGEGFFFQSPVAQTWTRSFKVQ